MEILKGNFKTKKDIKLPENSNDAKDLNNEYKKNALASIGGSMVYVERDMLTWEGDKSE